MVQQKGLPSYRFALEFRQLMKEMMEAQIERLRPRYNMAVVVSVDGANNRCTVRFPGDGDSVVSMGSVRPTVAGQIVRVAGLLGDRYIDEVLNGPMPINVEVSLSLRAAGPFRKAVTSGTARIMYLGDSKTEGTGVGTLAERWQDLVTEKLRTAYGVGGDTGVGYIPSHYFTFWGLAEGAVLSGIAVPVGNDAGLGTRTVAMQPTGKITWPIQSFNRVRIWYGKRTDNFGNGSFETFIDGVSKGVTSCNGADSSGNYVEYTATAGYHVLEVRHTSGGGDCRVEGAEFRTATTGIMGYDGSHAGFTSRHYAIGMPESGSPDTDIRHWEAVQAMSPHLIICSLGSNDMASITAQEWGENIRTIAERCEIYAPGSGLIFMHSAERQADLGTPKLGDFIRVAREVLADFPRATLVYESSTFQPITGADADPYNVWSDELEAVHPNANGNIALAEVILSVLAPRVN